MTSIVSSGSPSSPQRFGDLVAEHRADRPVDVADRQADPHRLARARGRPRRSSMSGVVERLLQAVVLRRVVRRSGVPSGTSGIGEDRRQVEAARPSSARPRSPVSSSSTCPIASSRLRKPSAARYSRTSWAMNSKKVTTNSGLPENRARSSGFWVATPTGQVSRWQTRIMMQPETTSGAVAKPNSSAPSSAAMTTSRPVFSWPSVCTTIRSRSPLSTQRLLGLGQAELPRRAGVLERGQRAGAGAAVVARR